MSIPFRYLALLLMAGLCMSECSRKEDSCLKGRVVRVSCASFVIQVLNKDSVGNYGWRDIKGNTIYNNVFRVSNNCKIGKWGKGEELYFTLKSGPADNDCIACMMQDAPPAKSYQIENVSTRHCK